MHYDLIPDTLPLQECRYLGYVEIWCLMVCGRCAGPVQDWARSGPIYGPIYGLPKQGSYRAHLFWGPDLRALDDSPGGSHSS